MTSVPATNQLKVIEELVEEELGNEVSNQESNQVPPIEYKHDASKAPVLEEEEFDFTIASPDE